MRRRIALGLTGLLIAAATAAGAFHLVAGRATPARSTAAIGTRPMGTAAGIASASPTLQPLHVDSVADRLTIRSMRSRTYPASTLVAVKDDGDMGGYVNTVVSFQSDGLTEYALRSVPDGPKPEAGWPVIIINHGYTDPATYVTDDGLYADFIAAFARAGFMVVKPDYRGHGKSQGVAEGGHLSPVYAYDLLNLVSTLAQDGTVDETRIGLFGHSMGAHEVLRAMVVSTHIKAVVVASGVVGSFNDIFYNWPHPSRPLIAPATQQQLGSSVVQATGSPSDDPQFWDSASAINYVSRTTAVVQVDQTADDTEVPKLFSDHLVAALQAAGKTVEYNVYPGDDHTFRLNRDAILARTVAFYNAHL